MMNPHVTALLLLLCILASPAAADEPTSIAVKGSPYWTSLAVDQASGTVAIVYSILPDPQKSRSNVALAMINYDKDHGFSTGRKRTIDRSAWFVKAVFNPVRNQFSLVWVDQKGTVDNIRSRYYTPEGRPSGKAVDISFTSLPGAPIGYAYLADRDQYMLFFTDSTTQDIYAVPLEAGGQATGNKRMVLSANNVKTFGQLSTFVTDAVQNSANGRVMVIARQNLPAGTEITSHIALFTCDAEGKPFKKRYPMQTPVSYLFNDPYTGVSMDNGTKKGQVLVTWNDRQQIWYALSDKKGRLKGKTKVQGGLESAYPAVTWSPEARQYLLVYTEFSSLRYLRVDEDGTPLDKKSRAVKGEKSGLFPKAVWHQASGEFLAVWVVETENGKYEIRYQAISPR